MSDKVDALLSQNGAPSGFIFFERSVETALEAGVEAEVFSAPTDEGLWLSVDSDTVFAVYASEEVLYSFSVPAGGWFPIALRKEHTLRAASVAAGTVNILVAENA